MKRKITLSIALALSLMIGLLTNSDSKVEAQNQLRFAADTGVITLGPNQILRLTVATGDVTADDSIRVRFRRMKYIEQGNIYRIDSQTTSSLIMLAPNEAAVVDAADYVTWRLMVLSNSRNVKVLGIVFDTSTQRITDTLELEWVSF